MENGWLLPKGWKSIIHIIIIVLSNDFMQIPEYVSNYLSRLGIVGWGTYASCTLQGQRWTRLTLMADCGLTDVISLHGCRRYGGISPRFRFLSSDPSWSLNAGVGMLIISCPLIPHWALSRLTGTLLNNGLSYIRVMKWWYRIGV